jgi:hypothetical protein
MGRLLKTILDELAVGGSVKFEQAHVAPWLLWTQGRPSSQPIVATTLSGSSGRDVLPSVDPLVFEVVKGVSSAFPFGVTLGRTENNDVVLRHGEVSRFHGFIHTKEQGFWLTDTNSRNGIFLDGQALVPQKGMLLPEQGIVELGALKLEYYGPRRFLKYLQVLSGQVRRTGA